MTALKTLRITMYFFICIYFILSGVFAGKAESGETAERAIVKNDSLAVHSRMSDDSGVVKKLKKGDAVTVEFEVGGGEEEWCGIREEAQTALLGYVRCSSLERDSAQKAKWKNIGTKVISVQKHSRKEKAISSPEKKLRPYSDVTAILYMTTW